MILTNIFVGCLNSSQEQIKQEFNEKKNRYRKLLIKEK